MKKIIFTLILLSSLLFSEEIYDNYAPQQFFSRSDVDAFFKSETGELLKKIMVDGETYYMQQDGDLFEEDVATIEDRIFAARDTRYSFGKSKRLLATVVYPSHQKAFYSNCDYKVKQKKLIPIHSSCGFKHRKNKKRSQRIEWEHVVPAWHFGHQLRCWQKGGRMNCRETNTKFRQMEADMHNLVPAIGEINGDRSNFKFGVIKGENRAYGKVNMEIDFGAKKAEPQKYLYGDIARTYFYMRDRYGLRISKSQEKMFIAWNNLDPVTRWEKKKNQIIKNLQGDENLYVTHYQKIEQLGKPKTNQSTSFNEVKEELSKKYADFLKNFSAPLAGIILLVMTFFVILRRKKETKKQKRDIASRSFMLLSKMGEYAISINTKDEIMIEKADPSNPNQQWIFTKANRKKECFFLENLSRKMVIEIKDANSNDGAKVILGRKKNRKNDHQEWRLETSKDKGYVFVVNKWALNVLDIRYKKIEDGARLQSFHKKSRGTENQEWRIEKIDV
jgi:deoxyribonuclease-1